LFATLQQPPALICGSTSKGNKMSSLVQEKQSRRVLERPENQPLYVVGMDAHSRKLAISIWEWSDPWRPLLYKQIPNFEIVALGKTYTRHVPLDSITLIEASTNAFHLKAELERLGYRAEVVKSDVLQGKEKKRKICDSKDAENLALAYIHGDIKEFVWSPSEEYEDYRDLVFAYRDCEKDLVRISNRIWSICNRKGLNLGIVGGKTKAEDIRVKIQTSQIDGIIRMRLEMLVDDYENAMNRRTKLKKIIAEYAISNETIIALMQLPGVNFLTAFTTFAAVGDVKRFSTPSKLAAYGGFAPILNTSGEEEKRAQQKGGTGKPLDNEGRRDLKFFYGEAAQAVLNTCGDSVLGKWGWHMIHKGKPKNKVVCAIARKLLCYAWHILRHDPTPNREGEKFFKRKLIRFCGVLGRERIRELGYNKREDFANKHTTRIYAGLLQVESEKGVV
jgi:transposase